MEVIIDATSDRGPYAVAVTIVGGLGRPRRAVLVTATVLTVLVAVFSDVVAGEPPLHVASLGAVVAGVAVLRVRLGGRHRRPLLFICACIIAQPVLHAVMKLLPHGGLRHGHGTEIGRADLVLTSTQVAVVIAVVAAICLAERLVVAVTGVVRACWVRLLLQGPPSAPTVLRRRPTQAAGRPRLLHGRGTVVKRGPPPAVLGVR
ncbi:hypothetical protein ACVGOW_12170 [Pseudonocardia saturnea]